MLSHIKDEAIVEVWPLCTNSIGANLPASTIHNVERVIYTDNARDINDPGKTIEELEDRLSKERENFDNLSALYEKTEAEYRVTVAKLEAYKATEPNPEHKIKLRAVTPLGSDYTRSFVVENCEGMRLGDFVIQANTLYKYTTFRISDANGYIGDCEYENGNMKSSRLNAKKVCGIDDRIVKSAKANGGLGQMSYGVQIESV
jgi:hypothetical protein